MRVKDPSLAETPLIYTVEGFVARFHDMLQTEITAFNPLLAIYRENVQAQKFRFH